MTPDALLAHGIRAGVLAFLADPGAADFAELARALEVKNNILSDHLARLEAAGYVVLQRGFRGRRPRMSVRLTARGRKAWAAHVEGLT